MTDEIAMADLPLESLTGKWVIKVGTQRKIVPIDQFRVRLKAAMLNLESCTKQFGKESRVTRKAERSYNFLYKQIDQEQSDTFALLMFKTESWTV